jgi:hypothetical protein
MNVQHYYTQMPVKGQGFLRKTVKKQAIHADRLLFV